MSHIITLYNTRLHIVTLSQSGLQIYTLSYNVMQWHTMSCSGIQYHTMSYKTAFHISNTGNTGDTSSALKIYAQNDSKHQQKWFLPGAESSLFITNKPMEGSDEEFLFISRLQALFLKTLKLFPNLGQHWPLLCLFHCKTQKQRQLV